jgi:hypothetical protein
MLHLVVEPCFGMLVEARRVSSASLPAVATTPNWKYTKLGPSATSSTGELVIGSRLLS